MLCFSQRSGRRGGVLFGIVFVLMHKIFDCGLDQLSQFGAVFVAPTPSGLLHEIAGQFVALLIEAGLCAGRYAIGHRHNPFRLPRLLVHARNRLGLVRLQKFRRSWFNHAPGTSGKQSA